MHDNLTVTPGLLYRIELETSGQPLLIFVTFSEEHVDVERSL